MRSCPHIYSVLLLIALLSLSALPSCSHKDEVDEPEQKELLSDSLSALTEQVVLITDSTEWRVRLFKEHVLYSELSQYALPKPWRLPTHEEAATLRHCKYPTDANERFFTDDGYTFQMPSPSVTKAGSKQKYSILGLYVRRTVILVTF